MTDKEFITKESLQNLTNNELKEVYFENFGINPPSRLTKIFLIKDILWRLEFGKNSDILQKRIDKLVKDYSKTKAVNISKVKQFETTKILIRYDTKNCRLLKSKINKSIVK